MLRHTNEAELSEDGVSAGEIIVLLPFPMWCLIVHFFVWQELHEPCYM